MKSSYYKVLVLVVACALLPGATSAATGSIPVSKSTPVSSLPTLAKQTMIQAINAALAVAPGAVIEAKLVVGSGTLQYNVIIVGPDKSLFDADVDAGTGRVLQLEKDGEEIDLDAPPAKPAHPSP